MMQGVVARGTLGVCTLVAVGITVYAVYRHALRHDHKRYRVRKSTLQAFQALKETRWVALCGQVFDVTNDPFFEPQYGVYGEWCGHDITCLLVTKSVVQDNSDDAQKVLYDQPVDTALVTPNSDDSMAQQRWNVLKEWFLRFTKRYQCIGVLEDHFCGREWDAIRNLLLHDDDNAHETGGCPFGFGRKRLAYTKMQKEDKADLWVVLLGVKYDVTKSPWFHPHGSLASFVGKDITFALATQQLKQHDTIEPEHEFTYEEQVRLEYYRTLFTREFPVIQQASDRQQSTEQTAIDLHATIEQGDIQKLIQALKLTVDVNAVCPRTTMTPLHKAVEANQLEMVQVLVQHGANCTAQAPLYDDETPLEMAQRFHYEAIASFLTNVQ